MSRRVKKSKTPKPCTNCGTIRYPIHAQGYCKDCYGLLRRKRQIEAWDFENSATLKGYPRAYVFPQPLDSPLYAGLPPERLQWIREKNLKEFLKFKQVELEKIDDRLRAVWSREQELSGPIDGMDIELMLRQIAHQAGARDRNLHYGVASAVTYYFNAKQRKILFEWLNEIVESAPWGPRRRWRRFPPLQIRDRPEQLEEK